MSELETEPSAGLINWLYGTSPGRVLTNLLVSRPWFSELLALPDRRPASARKIAPFVQSQGIDMSEYLQQDYRSFADFFIRSFRPGARPIDGRPEILISPADAKLLAHPIAADTSVWVKGASYTVAELVGGHPSAADFAGGICLVFRLGLENCHRYCFVDSGRVVATYSIPGRLDTVRAASDGRRRVLARNHRIVSMLETAVFGNCCQIDVGALTVGKIVLEKVDRFVRGQERGHFELGGSTIVLFFGPGTITLDEDIWAASQAGSETAVKLGSAIGHLTAGSTSSPAVAPSPADEPGPTGEPGRAS